MLNVPGIFIGWNFRDYLGVLSNHRRLKHISPVYRRQLRRLEQILISLERFLLTKTVSQATARMRSVVLLLLGVHLAYAGTHTYQYFYTATSGLSNFPKFVAVGMVNGEQINYYDSSTMEAVIKADWVKGILNPTELKNIWLGSQQTHINNVQVLMNRYNQSDVGVHTLQLMYGCELNDDGSARGYYQYGYDGVDFLSLDKSTRTWTASNPQAVITKHKWEATGAEANYWKGYLENTCIEWVQKYVGYGKDTLERKVSPQVSLLQKDSSSSVSCHATGFYPSGVTISWQKNGQDHYENVDLGELLPNEDGTFQRTSTLNVGPDEWKNNEFNCVVEHQGKTIRGILTDDSSDSVSTGIIVGVVVVALIVLVVSGVVGFVVYRRRRDNTDNKDFKRVSQNPSDDVSNES